MAAVDLRYLNGTNSKRFVSNICTWNRPRLFSIRLTRNLQESHAIIGQKVFKSHLLIGIGIAVDYMDATTLDRLHGWNGWS